MKRAKDILCETGAQDIGAAGEKAGDFSNTDKPRPRVRGAGTGKAVADEELYAARAVDDRATRDVDEM